MIVLFGLNASPTALFGCQKALKMCEVLTDRAAAHLILDIVAPTPFTYIKLYVYRIRLESIFDNVARYNHVMFDTCAEFL
jgi:hypothetical protein